MTKDLVYDSTLVHCFNCTHEMRARYSGFALHQHTRTNMPKLFFSFKVSENFCIAKKSQRGLLYNTRYLTRRLNMAICTIQSNGEVSFDYFAVHDCSLMKVSIFPPIIVISCARYLLFPQILSIKLEIM